jgi:hypothetical protein
MHSHRCEGGSTQTRWLEALGAAVLAVGFASPRAAEASLLTKVGSIVAPTAATGNQSYTGVGFRPKALIFFSTGQTATGFSTGAVVAYGFSAGPGKDRVVTYASDDNVTTANYKPTRWQSTRCILVTAGTTGTKAAAAAVVSLDADGFTLNWQNISSAFIVHYMALGGSEITNANGGTFTPSAGTGSQAVTGVGFQPDFLMFLSIDSDSTLPVTPHGKVSLGYAGRSSAYGITQGGVTAVAQTGGNITTSGAQKTGAAILEKDTTVAASSPTFTASVTSFDPDGFTVNKTVNTGGTETVVGFLALQGGQYRVGAITRPTADIPPAAGVSYTGVGFRPHGLLFTSWNLVSQDYDEDARISFSAADTAFSGAPWRPNQRATFFHDKMDNPADGDNSWVKQATSGSDVANGKVVYLAQGGSCPMKFLEGVNPNQCWGLKPPQVVSEADIVSYDGDGFTLNWTLNDRSGANQIPGDEESAQVLYVAFGDNPPTSGLFTKVSTFYAPGATTGNQSVTGVGFRPKAVIFFWASRNSPGFASSAAVGYGFATGAGSERAVNYLSDDNLAPNANNASRWQWTNRCVVVTNTSASGATYHEATFVSMDADGFTLNWTKASIASAWIIHYMALGGPDITNATVGSFTPTAGTGSQSVSALGFQPEFLMFMSIDSNAVGSKVATHGKVSLGFAADGTSITQAAITAATKGLSANAVTSGAESNDSAIVEKSDDTAAVTFEGAVTSFDATGFTIDKLTHDAVDGPQTTVHYLALRGGRYKVGWLTRPGTDGAQTIAYPGVGFTPKGLLFFSWSHLGSVLDPIGDSEARISFSAADSTFSGAPYRPNQRAVFFHDKTDIPSNGDYMLVRQGVSGSGPTSNGKLVYLAQAGDCSPRFSDPAGTDQCSSTTARLLADADVASYDSDGFTLNWTTNDVTNTNDWAGDERDARVYYVAVTSESTTEVKLSSFAAEGEDSAVALEWQTSSELDNLGFQLYRSMSESGPWTRITSSLIPGLGSSPIGGRYGYTDSGLTNGVRYYYELEDVETSGRTERHGPVSAVPLALVTGDPGEGADPGSDPGGGSSTPVDTARKAYADPSTVSLRVLRRDSSGVDLELTTGGFYATPQPDGSMRLDIPGFQPQGDPGTPAIPVERTFLKAVAGRQVRIASVVPSDVLSFPWPRPALARAPELVASRDGVVEASFRKVRPAWVSRHPYPAEPARIVTTAFQGETKKALLELAPLQWSSSSGQLLLARRLRVRVIFDGSVPGEIALGGSRGRFVPLQGARRSRSAHGVVAHLLAGEGGLYAVSFEDALPDRLRGVSTARLRLTRLGKDVAFHVEPDPLRFTPGSVLYFLSEGGSLSAYTNEAVYELAVGSRGTAMPVVSSPPAGDGSTEALARRSFELNRYYVSGLLDAPDIWLWDSFPSGAPAKSFTFSLSGLAPSRDPATLSVDLQGATDFDAFPDHHVRISVNGSLVAEASWDGKTARRVEALLFPGTLHEGDNSLAIENVADTPAASSLVYLDRFSLDYPHALTAERGRFEASFGLGGSATVTGLGPASLLLDTTNDAPRWLVSSAAGPSGLSFAAEAGHRYLAVSPEALLKPTVRWPSLTADDLRSTHNQADYLLIAPRELLSAAAPLVELREEQGLRARAVPLEEVYDSFGYGEKSPEAIRDFIAFAWHHWTSPAPRYVLLLGDATFDPKDYARTGVRDLLPVSIFRSTWMWTASDSTYASVNGDDDLPDLAIGRLPAASLEQAQTLVRKLVDFERAGFDPQAPAVLVADDPDKAGDFETDSDDIAAGPLAGVPTEKIYLGRLGTTQTRSEILSAFDRGVSLMSYVGHGGITLWATENVLASEDLAKLTPQARQPLLFTMNCLNGYFFAPAFDSLAEALVKAENKGAIAAVAPSGLSLDSPAHLYHEALLAEITSGQRARLGDAILAAQGDYAATGAFPELLRLYNLLGDPAMSLR